MKLGENSTASSSVLKLLRIIHKIGGNRIIAITHAKIPTLTLLRLAAFAIGGDRKLIDTLAFDGMCNQLRSAGHAVTRPQNGFLPGYLRLIALGAVALGVLVFWIK